MGKKRFIHLAEAEELTLRSGMKFHPKAEFRMKCQALLLSHSGLDIKQIGQILGVLPVTIGSWFTVWESRGICGFQRSKGQGRKPILNIDNSVHQRALVQVQEEHYQDAKAIQAALESELKIGMSTDTVKRFLKKIITPGVVSAAIPKRGRSGRNTRTNRHA